MGIPGLSSFINNNLDICKPFKLHDTTVIFDGSNLMHVLYCKYDLDFRYGGEYARYYDCVKIFLSNFLECSIKPIIVIDGGNVETVEQLNNCTFERTEKCLERAKKIASGQFCPQPVFPFLMPEVFYSVLFDLGIQFAHCDFDADGPVAALGNYYKCPIISNDSDFFIFDLVKGVIHFDSIDPTINLDTDSEGKEYKFLNCKIYYIDEFVKVFPGLNKSVLPLFGCLIEKEFVEPGIFENFFSNIHLPEYTSKQISFHLRYEKSKQIIGILCWLQYKNLDEAVNEVTSYFDENDQENIEDIIDVYVYYYALRPCDLVFIFENNINDPRNDFFSTCRLLTPCENPLPQNFVLKFHQGHFPRFFIDVIVIHTAFLSIQIEDMELKSSSSCSSYIRQVLYGILTRHDIDGTECKNKDCLGLIQEYDRHGSSLQMTQVCPIFSVEGIGLLPKINEVHFIDKNNCIAILAKILGINSSYFHNIPDEWQLFIGSMNYWLRISGCRSEAFVSAVVLNLIYFDLIKCKNPVFNQKRCPWITLTNNKCKCFSITCIAANISESDLKYTGKMLDEYYINPTLKPDKRLFLNVAHSFNQIQSCLSDITNLNQLLNDCLKKPTFQNCFSGIMLYNLTEAINLCPIPKMFIGKMLGKDLNLLFNHLKSKIFENAPNFSVSERLEPKKIMLTKGKQNLFE